MTRSEDDIDELETGGVVPGLLFLDIEAEDGRPVSDETVALTVSAVRELLSGCSRTRSSPTSPRAVSSRTA